MSGYALRGKSCQTAQREAGRFSPIHWENPDGSEVPAGKREVMEKFFTPLRQGRHVKDGKKSNSPAQERHFARAELFTTASSSPSSSSAWSSSPWSSEASIEKEAFLVPSALVPGQHSKSCVDLSAQGPAFHKDGKYLRQVPGLSRGNSKSMDRLAHRVQRTSGEVRLPTASSHERSLAINKQNNVLSPQQQSQRLTARATSKGILKNGLSPDTNLIRKAKSMEALTAKTSGKAVQSSRNIKGEAQSSGKVGRQEAVKSKESQLPEQAQMKKKGMEEKQRFSQFLNEITRQVLSPSSLSSLVPEQQQTSLGYARKKHKSSSTDSSGSKDSKRRGSLSGSLPENLQVRQKESVSQSRPSRRRGTSPDNCSVSSAPSQHRHSTSSTHRVTSTGRKSPRQQTSPRPSRHRDTSTSPEHSVLPTWQRGRPDLPKEVEPGLAMVKNPSRYPSRGPASADVLDQSLQQGRQFPIQRQTCSSEDVSVCQPPPHPSQHGRQRKTESCEDVSFYQQPPLRPEQCAPYQRMEAHEETGRYGTMVAQRRWSPYDRMNTTKKLASLNKELLEDGNNTRFTQEPGQEQQVTVPPVPPDIFSCPVDAVESVSLTSAGHLSPGQLKLRDELDILKERFSRLQDEYSSTQLNNHFLKEKLETIAQTIASERQSLNQRIADLMERLNAAQNTTSGSEKPNASTSPMTTRNCQSLEKKNMPSQASLVDVPPVAPPLPFMDTAPESLNHLLLGSSHSVKDSGNLSVTVPSVAATGTMDWLDMQGYNPIVLLEMEKHLEVLKVTPNAVSRNTAFTPWKQHPGVPFPSLEQFHISIESECCTEDMMQVGNLHALSLKDCPEEHARRHVPCQEGRRLHGAIDGQRSTVNEDMLSFSTDSRNLPRTQYSFLSSPLPMLTCLTSSESSGDDAQEDWLKLFLEKRPTKKEREVPIDSQSAQMILDGLVSTPLQDKGSQPTLETLNLRNHQPRGGSNVAYQPYTVLDNAEIDHHIKKAGYHARSSPDATGLAKEFQDIDQKRRVVTDACHKARGDSNQPFSIKSTLDSGNPSRAPPNSMHHDPGSSDVHHKTKGQLDALGKPSVPVYNSRESQGTGSLLKGDCQPDCSQDLPQNPGRPKHHQKSTKPRQAHESGFQTLQNDRYFERDSCHYTSLLPRSKEAKVQNDVAEHSMDYLADSTLL